MAVVDLAAQAADADVRHIRQRVLAVAPDAGQNALAAPPQTFSTTRDGALSYFVGGDSKFPKDTGFALKGWKQCEAQNAAVFISGDSASSMGNVKMTDKAGKVTTVDKTWKYVKDDAGKLRIVLHHSSLPYSGT